jgi:hypothetical protein
VELIFTQKTLLCRCGAVSVFKLAGAVTPALQIGKKIMTCYHPIVAWRSRHKNENGKYPLVFNRRDGYQDSDHEIKIPCGRCIGCRLEYSRQWAVRCIHEASLYDHNCFITLTFDENRVNSEYLWSLDKCSFVKFMKRLRKQYGSGIRFFHCGEYGEKFERPHHHACLFNHDFPDKYLWTNRNNVNLYRSESLERLWPYGFSTIGDVTFESAAYVARYVVKKITGDSAESHYNGRLSEYVTMSRRPGIAHEFMRLYGSDFRKIDGVIQNGLTTKLPKYYNQIYDEQTYKQISYHRRQEADDGTGFTDHMRLKQRELTKTLTIKSLKRELLCQH